MNKKIKILHLITGLKIGGAERVLYDIVKNLNKEKFQPVVVSIIPIGKVGKEIQKLGIKVLSLNAKFKYDPFIVFKLISIFRKEKPQILHCHLFHADFLGRIVGKICRVPIIISTGHSINIGGKLREKLLRYTDDFHNITIAVSEMVVKIMIKRKIIFKQKLKVIYNGIDLNKFIVRDEKTRNKIRKDLNIKEDENILISVGRLAEQKGHIYLIEAMDILKNKHPDIKLLIIGEGKERDKLEKKIRELNLTKNVLLLGEKKDIVHYLNVSNVFILPSLYEGLPLSLLEAMACGLPAVATDVGGVPESIKEGYSGFLVPPKNPKILAEKIDYVLNLSLEERNRLGRNGRKIVEEKFSLEKMVKEYEELYKRFLSKLK